MDLKITNCNNFFKIRGVLNKENLELFNSQFKNIFDTIDTLKLSIEEVDSMDKYGKNAIANLKKEAIERNKSLSILGF